jgi:WD40 repeat protein
LNVRSVRPGPQRGRIGPLIVLCALVGTTPVALPAQDAQPARAVEFEPTSKHLISLVAEPTAAALSPDGSTLATGDEHGAIIFWEIPTGRPVRRLVGHSDTVAALAFAPTGTVLASVGYDDELRIWDSDTGELRQVVTGHAGRNTCVAWSSDGVHLLTGGYDKALRLWNIAEAGAPPVILRDHTATIRAIACSPDGNRFASSHAAGGVRIWNGQTSAAPGMVDAGAVLTLVFLQDGQLCTGGSDGSVRLWQDAGANGSYTAVDGTALLQHSAPVTRLALSPDGTMLASADRNGGLRVSDVMTWQPTSSLDGHSDELVGLAFLPDSRSLLTTSRDRSVRVWRAKRPATPRLATIEAPEVRLWSLETDPQHSRVIAGGRKGFLALYDVATGAMVRRFEGFTGTVDAVSATVDGAHLAACCWKEKAVSIWDVEATAVRTSLDAGVNVRCVRFSPDGRWLAAGCEDGAVRIWDWKAGGDPRTISSGPGAVYDLAFSPNGKVLAGCGGDWTKNDPGFAIVWDADSWSERQRLTEHTRAVRSVVFSSDGTRLASAGEDGLIVLWHGETFVPVARLPNPAGLRPLAFSPDGGRLAAGLHDGTINVWDLSRGEVVQRCRAEDDVFGLAFSGDGSALFSVSGETRIEIWPDSDSGTGNDLERIRHWNRTEE